MTRGVNVAASLWAEWAHALASARQITTRNAAVTGGTVVALQSLLDIGVTVLSAALVRVDSCPCGARPRDGDSLNPDQSHE